NLIGYEQLITFSNDIFLDEQRCLAELLLRSIRVGLHPSEDIKLFKEDLSELDQSVFGEGFDFSGEIADIISSLKTRNRMAIDGLKMSNRLETDPNIFTSR
ncbi:hypothetical protein ENBRE01_3155, partial [Enteropsectra breve]